MSASYRGILFDLDGTLVDTLQLILESYRYTMRTHLGEALPDERWLRTMGRPLKVQLQEFAETPEQAEAMFQTYLDHNEENQERLIRSFPGVKETVEELLRSGYRVGIVTSKITENAWRELRSCRLDDLFETVIGATDVENPKPHPEPVLRGLEAIGCAPEETLLVGDSVYDLQSGRAAGVDTAAALWGPFDRETLAESEPDYWLTDIGELSDLLDGQREVDGG